MDIDIKLMNTKELILFANAMSAQITKQSGEKCEGARKLFDEACNELENRGTVISDVVLISKFD